MKRLKVLVLLFFIFSFSFKADSQLWKQYSDSANSFYDQRKFDVAIEYYIRAKEQLKKDSALTGSYATVCNSLGNSYQNLNQYEKAEPFYSEAKEVREKVFSKQSAEYASSCNNLGVIFIKMGKYEIAEPFYLEAKQIRKNVLGTENASYARSCNNLANLYLYTGKYDKAEPLYIEAMQIKERLSGKNLDYALSCNNLASLYMYMGQYKKSEPLNLESKLINEKLSGKTSAEYGSSCNNLALLYLHMGEYEKAEPLFLQALEIDDKVLPKGDPDYAIDCDNLGLLYREMGQYEKSEMMHLMAKQIREKVLTKKHPDYARSCNNLASLYMVMEQYNKAENLFIEARQIRENNPGKESPEYATSCHSLATVYASMGQYQKAEPFFLEAQHVREKVLGKKHPDYALNCYNLGNLYSDISQYGKAESYFLEAYNIRENLLGKEHPEYVESCINLGNIYRIMNKPEKANDFYAEAFQSQNLLLKKIFQFTSEVEQQSYLKKIAASEKKILSFYTSGFSHSHHGIMYNVSLFGRNLILSSSQTLRNAIYTSGDTGLQNTYNTWVNSREQLSFWYAKPIAVRPLYIKDMEEQSNTLEKELTRFSTDFKKEQSANEITWKDIRQNLKASEAAIEFKEFNYFDGKRWADSTYYIALVLRKDKPEPELVKLFEKKQLDSLLSYKKTSPGQQKLNVLYSVQEKITDKNQDKSLYDIIWKPLEEKLNGISKIYYAPAGSLYKIAFAALPVTNKQVLSDKYRLEQLNTTASVADQLQASVSVSDNIILYGGVQYDADSISIKKAALQYNHNDVATRSLPEDLLREGVSDFNYLKGSEQEVNQIEKLADLNKYQTTVFNGITATEESVKGLSGKNSPVVLHIATHGFFFPDPKNEKKDDRAGGAVVFKQSDNPLIRSGLALAGANNAWKGNPVTGVEDGILTSYEVSNMYLPNTKLVALSACETGLGDVQGSEGVYGLQRAFKMAGVQNLVMSLWRVDDIATSEFMQHFYKNLFAKQTINDAFYNAQAVMKNKYRTEPYKWAAWILVR